jgi:hypothetical protein
VSLIVALVWIAGTVFAFFAIIDSLRHTAAQWAAIGQSRVVWIILLIIGLGGGLFALLSFYYWLRVSPQLKAAQAAQAS